ncbi:MAG: permease-like cell division protein FtsX [Tissierellia bacterium]|nr:permease-like cell division protein FtsX [Tissierellia bacterium]
MRFIRQILNNIKEAFQGISRNKGLAGLSIISITAVLAIFGVILLLILNMTGMAQVTGEKVNSIVVYLYDDASDQEVQAIISELEATGHVKNVEFTSKEEALEKWKDELALQDNDYLLEGYTEDNPLPNSLTVELDQLEVTGPLAEKIQGMKGVERVDYLSDLVYRIMETTNWIKNLGILLVAILFFVAIILIYNTTKATLANRSREIHIMKYVGATNGYIRRPFLIEGLIFGLVASLLALAIIYFGYASIYGSINQRMEVLLSFSLVKPEGILVDMGIIFACIGVGVGLIGSSFSIKRYLSV